MIDLRGMKRPGPEDRAGRRDGQGGDNPDGGLLNEGLPILLLLFY